MTNQVIPAEAVEAAAKAYWDKLSELGYRKWDDIPEDGRAWRRDNMQPALEAAAPYLMAHAWDGGRDATIRAVMSGDDYPTNPYMLNNEGEK